MWEDSWQEVEGLESVCVCARLLGHVQLSVTPWTAARQASLSVEFSRQEYWSGQPFPSLRHPGVPLRPPALAGRFFTTEPPGSPF